MTTTRHGATNSLVDVSGLSVGHAHRIGDGWRTGVTVVVAPEEGAVAGVDVRGGAPGTRETDLLDPRNLVERVNAVTLCGGSAYGLAAADGVMRRLADAGRGVVAMPGIVVPIVPAAVIFDLGRGGLTRAAPDAAMGAAGYDARSDGPVTQGSVGAGAGAQVGGFAGGVGSASAVLPDGITVAGLAVVNAAGFPADRRTGELHAARHGLSDEFAVGCPDPAEVAAWRARSAPEGTARDPESGLFNTVIGVVGVDVALTKAQCGRLAGAAHDGLARAIHPTHTMTDGDTIFGLATGTAPPDRAGFDDLLAAAADVFARSIGHAVLAATSWPGAPSYREVFPSAIR